MRQKTSKSILFLLLLMLFLPPPVQADNENTGSPANGDCNTSLIAQTDFVDFSKSGILGGDLTAIPPYRSAVLVGLKASAAGIPAGFPKVWKNNNASPVLEMITLRENGTRVFQLIRFSSPLTLCQLLEGWEEWQKNILTPTQEVFEGSSPNVEDVLLVFERNGRLEALSNSILIWLSPGTSPAEFRTRILEPMQKAKLLKNNDSIKVSLDAKSGMWKVSAKTAPGMFPLRVALQFAGYREALQDRARIAKIEPLFIPLVSAVKTRTWVERMVGGRWYTLAENEPVSIEQYDLSGMRINVAIDLLKDKTGTGQLKILSDEYEFGKKLRENFSPTITSEDMELVGSGCIKRQEHSPHRLYDRYVFSCTLSLLPAGDFTVKKVELRFEETASGRVVMLPTERDLLVRVIALSHPEQEGINPFLPKALEPPRVVEKKDAILPPPSPPAAIEPTPYERWNYSAERFAKEKIKTPFQNLWGEVIKSPRVFLRTTVFRFFFIAWVVLAVIVILFIRWGKLPSVIEVLVRACIFFFTGAQVASLPFRFRNPYRGWRSYIALASGVKNPYARLLARRFGITMPTDPEEFLSWAESAGRSELERALAALWLEETISEWKNEHLRTRAHAIRKLLGARVAIRRALVMPRDIIRLRREVKARGG